MRIDIITIFPKMFKPVLDEAIIKRAQNKGLAQIEVHNLRDYSKDKHRKVDDRPFGGGPGMVFRPEPVFEAVESVRRGTRDERRGTRDEGRGTRIILLSPQGRTFNQKSAQRLSKYKNLILICARYEGVDERVRQHLVDEEVSIGDYVLTGGELPAMVLIDTIIRLIPGVLGDKNSAKSDSFSQELLEYPQYTRPENFREMKVPGILLSGDHQAIADWRKEQSYKVTKKKRPDLLMKPPAAFLQNARGGVG